MDPKKTVIVVVAVVVIVVAIVLAIRGSRGKPPTGVQGQPKEVVVVGTNEVTTVSVGDWAKMPVDDETGYRRDGNRLLSEPHICISCGAKIPQVPMPKVKPGEPMRMEIRMYEYKCPVCGKPAYQEGLGPRPEGPPM